MAEDAKTVSEEVGELLHARGWSQSHLARVLGTSQPNVSLLVTGKWDPPPVYRLAIRHLIDSTPMATIPKKAQGRPLVDLGFDLSKAQCDYRDCKRGNRQMRGDHHCVYQHPLLGRILPVFCNGTHAHRHARVTRALDLKGRLWKLSDFPHRKKLAPFEAERVRRVRKEKGELLCVDDLANALQHCTSTLDGRPGCQNIMTYDGRPTKGPARQKLHIMYCRNDCGLQWERRFFDANGDEQRGAKWGEHCLGRRNRELPPNAKKCPVCGVELRYPMHVSEIGGVSYHPPLLRVTCLNPQKTDHSPRVREELGLPAGSRKGLTFYYDQKHSKFIQIHLKALKKGHPVVRCREHGRMQVTTITNAGRVPERVYKRLGSTLPVELARCRFRDQGFWISTDRKTRIPYAFRPKAQAVNAETKK